MGHPHYDLSADAAPGKRLHGSPDTWRAPRLSKALFTAKPGTTETFQTSFEKKMAAPPAAGASPVGPVTPASLDGNFTNSLKDLLQHIEDRLKKGLLEAWFSLDGYMEMAGPNMRDSVEASYFWDEPEEQWARVLAEAFVFTAYYRPDTTYNNSGMMDAIYKAFPRVFPVALECQHLSTFAAIARGFPYDQMRREFAGKTGQKKEVIAGFSCSGGSVMYPVFSAHRAKFGPASPNKGKYTTTKGLTDIPITPGSLIVFNPGGEDYTGQDKSSPGNVTHAASVMRISGTRIQFFDTGVVSGNEESSGEGGTVDHSFRDGAVPSNNTLVGVGVLPAVDGGKLASSVSEVAKARPLGVVRLVVVDTSNRSTPEVRFVSKLVHMVYPTARLMWSLRKLPVSNLTVFWFVYAPQGIGAGAGKKKWSDALMEDAALSTSPADLFQPEAGRLMLVNVVRGEPDGSVTVFRAKEHGFIKNFEVTTSPPKYTEERGETIPLVGDTKLGKWCEQRKNFGLRFTRLKAKSEGEAKGDDTGVAFFDAKPSGSTGAAA